MRGGLDETLARLARREEALRRRAGEPGEEAGASTVAFETTGHPGRSDSPGWDRTGRSAATRTGVGRSAADERDPVEEVAEAVRLVVAEHPGLSVVVRVEHEGRTYPLRIDWADTAVTVAAENTTTPPPPWPRPVNTGPVWSAGRDGTGADPAARLAEMIRRDPALLADDRRP
ncbi:hypothetical protein FHX75_121613 [Micromonospora palomenae]|uniref:Uncharacterized protein n=1 Tax=Micromonospora palomenae TaxID=1461247 RepID=A0A561WGS3_9ACTN|nr:hypothetical protein [Micromonospora palomenae]TWG23067.1 hypothetical protein FHX75_121613 [Micromonospora palomenae]